MTLVALNVRHLEAKEAAGCCCGLEMTSGRAAGLMWLWGPAHRETTESPWSWKCGNALTWPAPSEWCRYVARSSDFSWTDFSGGNTLLRNRVRVYVTIKFEMFLIIKWTLALQNTQKQLQASGKERGFENQLSSWISFRLFPYNFLILKSRKEKKFVACVALVLCFFFAASIFLGDWG